jgi:hypothetical protein
VHRRRTPAARGGGAATVMARGLTRRGQGEERSGRGEIRAPWARPAWWPPAAR